MPPLIVSRPGVYCILNNLNDKRYVGSASKSLYGRIANHKSALRSGKHSNRHLQGAWNKYGERAFSIRVLCLCDTDQCLKIEQFFIDKYDSANPDCGYNISPTAGSCLGVDRPDAVETMREKSFRIWEDPEFRKRRKQSAKENSRRLWNDPEHRRKQKAGMQAYLLRTGQTPRGEVIKNMALSSRNSAVNRKYWDRVKGTPEAELRKLRAAFARYGRGRTIEEYAEEKRPDLLPLLQACNS